MVKKYGWVGLLIIAVAAWFYWFQWRPSQASKECTNALAKLDGVNQDNAKGLFDICMWKKGVLR